MYYFVIRVLLYTVLKLQKTLSWCNGSSKYDGFESGFTFIDRSNELLMLVTAGYSLSDNIKDL